MNSDLAMIHKKNKVFLTMFLGCTVVNALINARLNLPFSIIIFPLVFTLIVSIAFLFCKKRYAKLTMYVLAMIVYIPFILEMEIYPSFIHYILIWSAFLFSFIYKKNKVMIVSWGIVNVLTIYYFFRYNNSIFATIDNISVLHIITFNLFLMIIWILSERFSEKELWVAQQLLQSYFNHISDAIAICDVDGYVIKVNQTFQQLTGYDEKEIINKKINLIAKPHMGIFREAVKDIKYTKKSITIETLIIGKKNIQRYLLLTITPIKNRLGQVISYVCIGKDLTKVKQAETEIKKTKRLTVVGQLAAAVVHEIKNPLTVLKGFVQLLKQSDGDEKRSNYYDIMESELKRMLDITNDLLFLGKEQKNQFIEYKLQIIIHEVVQFLESEAEKNNVKLSINFPEDLPPIACHPNQMKQVFINIIKNGIESMPDGGNLIIQAYTDTQKQQMYVEVIDEGIGMSEHILEKIGTPFFTTKQGGTGLGMMVCCNIIKTHSGTMKIESEEKKGTKIIISLPLSCEKP